MAVGSGAARGLTLIELMVVVVVLAILATIVVPTYNTYITKARRADGTGTATAVALAQERHFSIYQGYKAVADAAGAKELVDKTGLSPELAKLTSPKGYYSWTVAACPGGDIAQCFSVSVTPVAGGAQANDQKCTEIFLDSNGLKDGKPADTHECWGKQ